MYIDLNVIGYGQLIDYAGVITPTQVTTTTEEVTDGGIVNGKYAPIYPNSEIEVSASHPVSTLTSIYRFENGQPYLGVDYATGATINGNTITLLTPLPTPITPIQITYNCTGIATASFTYPSYRLTPTASITNMIVAQCCGETGSAFITIEGPGGTGGGGEEQNKSDRVVRWLTITITPRTPVNADGQVRGTGTIQWPAYNVRPIVNTGNAKFPVAEGVSGVEWSVGHLTQQKQTIVALTVQAEALAELPGGGPEDIITPDGYVSGTRTVQDSNTKKPIEDVHVTIDWGDYTEPTTGYLRTNALGQFVFNKGKQGLAGTVTLTHPDYITNSTAKITIPGDLYSSNVNTGDDADTSVTKWGSVSVKALVPYTWERM